MRILGVVGPTGARFNLQHVQFLHRRTARELVHAAAARILERVPPNERHVLEYNTVNFVTFRGVCVVAERDVPTRVAFCHLEHVLDGGMPPLGEVQDTTVRIQKELDEIVVVMHRNIEKILDRGEKIEDLVERSNELSAQSRVFYKTARKHNSCCSIS